MSAIMTAIFAALVFATVWPDLPFSKAIVRLAIKAITALKSNALQARAVLAIGAALLIFATFWAFQGDAAIFLAMVLPELAVWFTTFEIATLAETLIGVGTAFVALRAAGAGNYLKGRVRKRRIRRTASGARKCANDVEPGRLALAA